MKYELFNSRTGEPIKEFYTTVDVVKTEKELVFEFICKNSQFFRADDKYNGPIFSGDVCEAFICTGKDLGWYYEIEVAPNNCKFLYKMHNLGDGNLEMFPIPEEECFLYSEFEKLSDTDYRIKFSLPLDKIGYDEKVGIRYNAYRIETEGGITDKNLLALNPTLCDSFHKPESFIKLK